jgi:O-antigen/teichoic acid export membrane protein
VLQGENLGYKRMGLSALLVVAQGALTALALILDTGIVGVAVANITGTFITGGTFLFVARRHVPWFGMSRPARATVKWFLGLSWWFTGWKVLMQLMAGGDLLVLGFFGSVDLVTVYALSKFVPEALTALLATIVQAVSPGLGGVIGKGEYPKAVRVRAELMIVTWLLVTVAGAGILVWNASFLGLWVSDVATPGTIATLLIVVTAAQFIFIRNDAFIIDLTLDLRPKVLIGFVATGLSLGLAAVFVSMGGGIVGLCIGLLIGRSILTVAYPWLIGRAIGQPLGAQLRGVLRPVLVTAVIFAAATSIGREFIVDSWVELVLGSIATAGVVAVVATFLGMNASQRSYLLRRARRMLPKAAGKAAR